MSENNRNAFDDRAPSVNPSHFYFAGGVLVLIAVALIVFALQLPTEPADAATLEPEDIKIGAGLFIRDAVLLDQYASSGTSDRTDAHHCVLFFDIANGQKVVVSLAVPTSGPLFETMRAYMNDENAGPGDCRLTLCATVGALKAQLAEYLHDYVKDVYDPLTPYQMIPVSLTMRGETPEEYTASMSRGRILYLAGGAACLLAGAAILAAVFRKRTNVSL